MSDMTLVEVIDLIEICGGDGISYEKSYLAVTAVREAMHQATACIALIAELDKTKAERDRLAAWVKYLEEKLFGTQDCTCPRCLETGGP